MPEFRPALDRKTVMARTKPQHNTATMVETLTKFALGVVVPVMAQLPMPVEVAAMEMMTIQPLVMTTSQVHLVGMMAVAGIPEPDEPRTGLCRWYRGQCERRCKC